MRHARRTRPHRSSVGVRRAAERFTLALCAAVLAAVGLGGAAAPAIGAAIASLSATAGSAGYGATPTPATVRAAGHGSLSGASNRVRPSGQHENSKPAFAAVHRTHPDLLPTATAVDHVDLVVPVLPAGRALSGAPTRAPPSTPGLPDTRAPPVTGRS